MFKKLLLTLIVSLIATSAYANKFSVSGFKVDDDEQMYYKSAYEVATADDTLTAAESGKTIIADVGATDLVFTLPTAAAGLTYRFAVADGGSPVSGIILNPQATDTFVGCVASAAGSTFSAGDDLDSAAQTGDTVTIVGASTKWYCVDRVGTWADGN